MDAAQSSLKRELEGGSDSPSLSKKRPNLGTPMVRILLHLLLPIDTGINNNAEFNSFLFITRSSSHSLPLLP